MRMYVEAILNHTISIGSTGIEELRWLVPVRPVDTIRGRARILETTPSEQGRDHGS